MTIMSDDEKHFPCTLEGCNMSFTNEDHLTTHGKKHDMVLSLESNGKSTVFVADQTPTPTRFIRNCEEVGLFQDLQNVNPFEETFRRAVEAGKTGTLTVPEAGITDDTLHTPHIFPHIADVLSDNNHILSENSPEQIQTPMTIIEKSLSKGKNSVQTQTSPVVNLSLSNSENILKNNELILSKKGSETSNNVILQNLNETTFIKNALENATPQLTINGQEVQLLLKTADGKLMQLSATPVSESFNLSNNISQQVRPHAFVIKTESPANCNAKMEHKKAISSGLSLAKMKLKQVLTNKVEIIGENTPKTVTKQIVTSNVSSFKKENQKQTVDQQKRDLLERNRASSMRARAKRKAWIQQLERTVINVNEKNAVLEMEVKSLRMELSKLKTLLLAHKDCPITKAMQKGNGVLIGSKIIAIPPDTSTTNTEAADLVGSLSLKRQAAFSLESSNVAKKIPLTIPDKPIILPKLDSNIVTPAISTGSVVKNVTTIKIMSLNDFLKEETNEQVVVLQDVPRNVNNTSPRQVIRLNPNYKIDNMTPKNAT